MAITIPKLTDAWIKSFYKGINQLIKKHDLTLIGGDTNKGPLSISFQVIGVNNKKILYRKGAKINDDIYVTGNLGDSNMGLNVLKKKIKLIKKDRIYFEKKYFFPEINRLIAKKLFLFANSSIDVSDGLIDDLEKLINDQNDEIIDLNERLNELTNENNKACD
jgi:thiamine-monophosphate kinase